MKLKNKLLRHFISAGVVVLTSSFLVYELVASHRDMSEYMRYIVEKGEAAFLYDKYQNQLIISQLSRKLDTSPSAEMAKQACDGVQTNGEVSGLNIAGRSFPLLHGTLSTTQSSCQPWVKTSLHYRHLTQRLSRTRPSQRRERALPNQTNAFVITLI